MNFSLEIGLKTDLSTLPNIKDVYITLLRGDQYKDVANKAKDLIKLGRTLFHISQQDQLKTIMSLRNM